MSFRWSHFVVLCLPLHRVEKIMCTMLQRENFNDNLIPISSYMPNWVMQWAHFKTSLKNKKKKSLNTTLFYSKGKIVISLFCGYNNQNRIFKNICPTFSMLQVSSANELFPKGKSVLSKASHYIKCLKILTSFWSIFIM